MVQRRARRRFDRQHAMKAENLIKKAKEKEDRAIARAAKKVESKRNRPVNPICQLNPTAQAYRLRIEKLLDKAGDRLNPYELSACKAWKTYSNYSVVQQKNIDKWLCKYELSGARLHIYKPWTLEMQSGGGYTLCWLPDEGDRVDVIRDLTKRDGEVLYMVLNDRGLDILEYLKRMLTKDDK